MRLLLDTHALLWVVMAPDRLGRGAIGAITAEGAEVYASHVSLWEMSIKRRIGKLDEIGRSAIDWFETFIPASRLRQLAIATRHLGAVEFLAPHHGDPFDRLLIAQASAEGLTIVTADNLIGQYDVNTIW